MSLTRFTFCLGLLILLSGVTAVSQIGNREMGPPQIPVRPQHVVGIPKGGAGMLEIDDEVIVYDQGRGKGKIISKTRTVDEHPEMHEFVIR